MSFLIQEASTLKSTPKHTNGYFVDQFFVVPHYTVRCRDFPPIRELYEAKETSPLTPLLWFNNTEKTTPKNAKFIL